MEELREFGLRHYYYINQIFGDLTLREIIQEEFTSPEHFTLDTEQTGAEFEHSFHHFCGGKSGRKWCSVDAGIQNILVHPHDTLCQSYSVMKYMGNIPKDTPLSENLQKQMVDMWRTLLNNKKIQEHIVHASQQYKNYPELQRLAKINNLKAIGKEKAIAKRLKQAGIDPYLFQNITPRSKDLINKIQDVLNEWEDYGWYWFMMNKKESQRC